MQRDGGALEGVTIPPNLHLFKDKESSLFMTNKERINDLKIFHALDEIKSELSQTRLVLN